MDEVFYWMGVAFTVLLAVGALVLVTWASFKFQDLVLRVSAAAAQDAMKRERAAIAFVEQADRQQREIQRLAVRMKRTEDFLGIKTVGYRPPDAYYRPKTATVPPTAGQTLNKELERMYCGRRHA